MEIQRRNIKFMTRGKLYWIIRHCNVYLTPVKKIIYKVKQRELWLVTHKKNNAKSVLREEMLLRGSRQALYSYLIGRLDSWQQNRKMLKDWDDVPYGAADCVSGHVTWENMVDYIKHSGSCSDDGGFTLYDDDDSTTIWVLKFLSA